MIGNLTHIMRLLIVLISAYLAENCPIFNEKVSDAFWIFSLTLFTMTIIGILYSTCEYFGLI